MTSSRHRIASSFVLTRLTSILGGRLLRLILPILCLLVFLAPAQAQTLPPPTNIRVNPLTGVATWNAVSGADLYRVNAYGLFLGSLANSYRLAFTNSLDLHEVPQCCTVGRIRYRFRVQTRNSNGVDGPFSPWTSFTYGVAPVSGSAPRKPTRTPTPPPLPIPTQDHSRLPGGAAVQSDSPWIIFREVSGPAIGDPAVRAAAMSAIDVWSPLGVDAEVCFAEDGSLLLLDAAYSPRAQLWMDSYQRADGKTCARLDRNGTVVLMPGQPAATPAPQATATPNPYMIADNPDDAVPLDDCMVSANWVLNFRESPGRAGSSASTSAAAKRSRGRRTGSRSNTWARRAGSARTS